MQNQEKHQKTFYLYSFSRSFKYISSNRSLFPMCCAWLWAWAGLDWAGQMRCLMCDPVMTPDWCWRGPSLPSRGNTVTTLQLLMASSQWPLLLVFHLTAVICDPSPSHHQQPASAYRVKYGMDMSFVYLQLNVLRISFHKLGQNAPLHCQNSAPGLTNIRDNRNVMQHMWGWRVQSS